MSIKYLFLTTLLLIGCGSGSESTSKVPNAIPESLTTDSPAIDVEEELNELKPTIDNEVETSTQKPEIELAYQRIIYSNVDILVADVGVFDLSSLLNTEVLEQYPNRDGKYYYDDNDNLRLKVYGGFDTAELSTTTSYKYQYEDTNLVKVIETLEYLSRSRSLVKTTKDTWKNNLKTEYSYNYAVEGEDSLSYYSFNYNDNHKISEKIKLYEDGTSEIVETINYLDSGKIDYYVTTSLESAWSTRYEYNYDTFDRLAYIKTLTYKNNELDSTTLDFYVYNVALNSVTTFSIDEANFDVENSTLLSSSAYLKFTTFYYENVEQCSSYQTLVNANSFQKIPQCQKIVNAPSSVNLLGIAEFSDIEAPLGEPSIANQNVLNDKTDLDENPDENYNFLRLKNVYNFSAVHKENISDYDLTPLLEDSTLSDLVNDNVSIHDDMLFYVSSRMDVDYYDDSNLKSLIYKAAPQNMTLSYEYMYSDENLSSITEVQEIFEYERLVSTDTTESTWQTGIKTQEIKTFHDLYPSGDWDGYFESLYRYEYSLDLLTQYVYKTNNTGEYLHSSTISFANGNFDEKSTYNTDGITINNTWQYFYLDDGETLEYSEQYFDNGSLINRWNYGYHSDGRLSFATPQYSPRDIYGNILDHTPNFYLYNKSHNAILSYNLAKEYNNSGHMALYATLYVYEGTDECGEKIEYFDKNVLICKLNDNLASTTTLAEVKLEKEP